MSFFCNEIYFFALNKVGESESIPVVIAGSGLCIALLLKFVFSIWGIWR